MYPFLDIEAGASTGNFAGGSRSDTTNDTAFISPVVNWEIDFWGKFRRATEAARADLMASEYSLRTVQLSLISEVVGAYYELLDYRQRLAISKATLKTRQDGLDIIQQRFDQGIIPELDLNQAQIQMEIAAGNVPLYERLIAKTEYALSVLTGELPGPIQQGKPLYDQAAPPAIPTGLPSTLLDRRPDIAEARYLLEAQTNRIGVAEALRYPAIRLTGVAGVASTELSNFTSDGGAWSIGAGLLGPIYNFDKNIRRVDIEEARTRQLLGAYEGTVLRAFQEVDDALVEIETYRRQITSAENRTQAAKNADELSQERYDQGVTSYLEVLESQRQLFNAQLGLSELMQLYLNGYVRLYKALGGGWITKEEMEQSTP
jgi:multidrug efflux system outer membrane protein